MKSEGKIRSEINREENTAETFSMNKGVTLYISKEENFKFHFWFNFSKLTEKSPSNCLLQNKLHISIEKFTQN